MGKASKVKKLQFASMVAKPSMTPAKAYKQINPHVTDLSASQAASKWLKDPVVIKDISDYVRKELLPMEVEKEKSREFIDAKRPVIIGKDVKMYPDYATQVDYVKHLHRLAGYIRETPQVSGDVNTINVTIDPDRLKGVADSLRELRKHLPSANDNVIEAEIVSDDEE